jgi:hypothetical protein
MSRITAALINGIAETSNAPVYLLHFRGTKKNPALGLLSGSVRRISALGEDFDYVSMDSVLGFDSPALSRAAWFTPLSKIHVPKYACFATTSDPAEAIVRLFTELPFKPYHVALNVT